MFVGDRTTASISLAGAAAVFHGNSHDVTVEYLLTKIKYHVRNYFYFRFVAGYISLLRRVYEVALVSSPMI